MVRPKFDPSRDFVAARDLTLLGTNYGPGDSIKREGATDRLLRMMYDSRRINFGEPEAVEAVTLKPASGGKWTIQAAWLDEPLTVSGKAKAEARAEEIREAGPPLGWIDGGSAVTIEGGEGGWYEVSAPWLDEPQKVQGRETAEARQRELHRDGEPARHHGVTLTPGENGWWTVTPEWDEEHPQSAHGEEAARELATQLRADGPPADPVTVTPGENEGEFVITTEGSDETEIVVGEEAATARAAEIRETLKGATLEPVEGPAASVLVSIGEDGKHTVSAPWLEGPEEFETAELAEARQAELREAGPPEGWQPAV